MYTFTYIYVEKLRFYMEKVKPPKLENLIIMKNKIIIQQDHIYFIYVLMRIVHIGSILSPPFHP